LEQIFEGSLLMSETIPPGEYTVTGPNGFSFTGGVNQAMELLPDTVARRQAVEDMYRIEKRKQDTEAQLAKALKRRDAALAERDAALEERNAIINDAKEIVRECSEIIEQTKAATDAHEEQERQTANAEQLAPIVGPEGEQPLAASDDGDLEAKHEVDPERYGPNEREDAEPTIKPPLAYPTLPTSYGKVPESYVKRKDTDLPPGHDPNPLNPEAPGEVDIPPPGPEPGSLDYPPHPQVAQPIGISMHGE
jgi:hypothetical protein